MTHLPPGQRERANFPRFGLLPFAQRFPEETERPEIRIVGDVEHEVTVPDPFDGLSRVEDASDFHCVTTWTRRGLRWGGVRFKDFFERVVTPRAGPSPDASFAVLRGQDGARTGMLLADLLAPRVLLADALDGEPLTVEHGAPVRLVAPGHYGYKSVKHLSRIEIRTGDMAYRPSGFRFMDHPRARVAREERGRWVPGWLLRHVYRPLVEPTATRFARAMDEHRQTR